MTQIRAYRAGDETGIRRLFETCHGRPLSPDVWAWRYGAAPDGLPVTEVGVNGAGEIVAHVSALRVSLAQDARTLPAGMWVDLMVHPDHRNLDLFLDMAQANQRRCAETGIDLLFAFPNDKSFPVLKRMLDWSDLGDIAALEGTLDALSPSQPAGWSARPVERFGAEHEALAERLRPAQRLCARRTLARLDWRYRGRPGASYPAWEARDSTGGVAGWVVVKVFDGPEGRVGDILDLWAPEEGGAFEVLLAAACAHFRANNVSIVSAWALAGTVLGAQLGRSGLKPVGLATHFSGRWTGAGRADFPSRQQDWLAAKGDSDVF